MASFFRLCSHSEVLCFLTAARNIDFGVLDQIEESSSLISFLQQHGVVNALESEKTPDFDRGMM